MLAEPNIESGANIDACVRIWPPRSLSLPACPLTTPSPSQKLLREDPKAYDEKIRQCVREQLGM